jgi:uncharacterized protein (TIGR02246 family)
MFTEAAERRDADALASLFSADAMLLPQNAEVVSGREAIRQAMQGLVDAGLCGAKSNSIKIEVDGDIATDVGHLSLYMSPPGGAPSVVEVKYLVVWKKIDGRWLIHRDMASARAPTRA